MAAVLITGSCGLIGAEAVRYYAARGMDVIGIDNNLREHFFGADGSTAWVRESLVASVPQYTHVDADIRDAGAIDKVFDRYGKAISLVIHTAAQPSHDWAARDPFMDFSVNATGTLILLEATRRYCPEAVFIFTSTNKVYGDTPNALPLIEGETRWSVDKSHPFANGIDESMTVDQSTHSLFGASKLAADVLVQEYGRYFGMRTGVFRGGCLTGPGHSGAQLHGFLAYLVKCAVTGRPYTVFGYKAKQVRDNIHSADLLSAFDAFFHRPGVAQVYNIGGGPESNCSMLEAIRLAEQAAGREMTWEYKDENRVGDHIWYVSDLTRFRSQYPEWKLRYDVPAIIGEIVAANAARWTTSKG